MNGKYDDIIHLPHHVSSTRSHMSLTDRAAQFSPFSALAGHDAAIKETARLTDLKIELSEDSKDTLGLKLNILADMASSHPEIAVTYFSPDDKKEGGSYITVSGVLKKIDNFEHTIVMMDSTRIPIDKLFEIECVLFKELI